MAQIIHPFEIDPVYPFQLDLNQSDSPLELARVIAHLEKIPWYLVEEDNGENSDDSEDWEVLALEYRIPLEKRKVDPMSTVGKTVSDKDIETDEKNGNKDKEDKENKGDEEENEEEDGMKNLVLDPYPNPLSPHVRILKKHAESLTPMMKLLPFPMILKMFQTYDFLVAYWSKELISTLQTLSETRLLVNYLNDPTGNSYRQELIFLHKEYNLYYNFTPKLLQKRLIRLQAQLPLIDLNQFYLGTDILLWLAHHETQKQFYSSPTTVSETLTTSKTVLTLYARDRRVTFKGNKEDPGQIQDYRDLRTVYLPKDTNLEIRFSTRAYEGGLGQLLLKHPEEQIVSDLRPETILDSPDLPKPVVLARYDIYPQLANDQGQQFRSSRFQPSLPSSIKVPTPKIYPWNSKNLTPIRKISSNSQNPSRCYGCQKYFSPHVQLDIYKDFCLVCALFNYQKREMMAPLKGKIVLITGIRQKIGFQAALKLLRCGATVIGTTRYPNATWYNYLQQPDFHQWKDRLHLYRCEFLDLDQVQALVKHLRTEYGNMDILIHNACQTIRPSSIYRQKVQELEQLLTDVHYPELTANHQPQLQVLNPYVNQRSVITDDYQLIPCRIPEPVQEYNSSQLSEIQSRLQERQIKFNQYGDVLDVDIKEDSSWTRPLEEVDPGEIVEATMINQMVPTILTQTLKPLLQRLRSGLNSKDSGFIITVTACEGRFNHHKTGLHAHTNMCKAGLNMMIRTLWEEKQPYLKVYTIDPGFVSGVNPTHEDFPLSAKDGAARILDPIIQHYRGTPLPTDREWMNLRNYLPTSW